MKTQVAIIGAGPAGLLLGQLLLGDVQPVAIPALATIRRRGHFQARFHPAQVLPGKLDTLHEPPPASFLDGVLQQYLTPLAIFRQYIAPAQLGLSQAATSHALARLRKAFGDQLLVRSGQTLQLTPEAERLVPIVEDIMRLVNSSLSTPDFDPATSTATFSLVENSK